MGAFRSPGAFLHRRIFFVFLLFVALPGLYLSYVGLRSIVREQELQRGLLVQGIERSLGFEIDRIEQRLEEAEERAARKYILSPTAVPPSAIEGLNAPEPWIERGFAFDESLNLRVPPPFAAERLQEDTRSARESPLQSAIEQARQLELRGEFGAAVSSYQRLLKQSLTLRNTVVLNSYLARSATAVGNAAMARRSYERIIQADSTLLISQPIPYAAFAWNEIINVLLKQDRPSDAFQISLRFYRRLLDFYYRLSSSQFAYYSQKLRSLLTAFEGMKHSGGELQSTLDSLQERERLLLNMMRQAGEFRGWLLDQGDGLHSRYATPKVSHHSVRVEERLLPISLVILGDSSGLRNIVILVVQPDELRNDMILPALRSSTLADGFDVTLRMDTVQTSGSAELTRSRMHETATLFPALAVSVMSRQTSTVDLYGVQASELSIGLGLLVVVVVLFGILIIYRDIRREEELSSMKSEFISNVSHELKTPIAAIRMLADNLGQQRVENEMRKMEYYQLISRESARLSHLLENILDFARIEKQKRVYRFERCNVSEIVGETVRQFKSLMDEHSQTIDVKLEEPLPEILGDADALALALSNLLDNAAKYSPKDSQINVRAHGDNALVCIEVQDHGVGIATKDHAKVFEKFYRVARADGRRIPGSGLGLTLVREIAEAHGGSVELQSESGKGSVFRLKVPTGG